MGVFSGWPTRSFMLRQGSRSVGNALWVRVRFERRGSSVAMGGPSITMRYGERCAVERGSISSNRWRESALARKKLNFFSFFLRCLHDVFRAVVFIDIAA